MKMDILRNERAFLKWAEKHGIENPIVKNYNAFRSGIVEENGRWCAREPAVKRAESWEMVRWILLKSLWTANWYFNNTDYDAFLGYMTRNGLEDWVDYFSSPCQQDSGQCRMDCALYGEVCDAVSFDITEILTKASKKFEDLAKKS